MNTDYTFNISSSPHVRDSRTSGTVMFYVIAALLPAAIAGVYFHGIHALIVLLTSVLTAVVTEFIFDYIVKKPNTITDGSAVVTGLLLGLSLPASVPFYVPFLGSLFAILIVKCFFGGLGKNFINPALAARCFLLISFSQTVTTFKVDGISAATPLADLSSGSVVNLTEMFYGASNGVIGSSALALLIGGLALWALDIITWQIPVSVIVSFSLFMALFGGQGFAPGFIAAHLFGGGLMMGAFFMATDYVTSPVTGTGQLIYGAMIGILGGLFRVLGSASDSFSYAIIISNLFVPIIDQFIVPKPYAYRASMIEARSPEGKKPLWKKIPGAALVLCLITLIAGVALSGVYTMTKDAIEAQELLAQQESFLAVCPDAETFVFDDDINAAIEALGGEEYGTEFGKVTVNSAVVGQDASGNTVGYVISVTSKEGFDGNITLSLGIDTEGTVTGIAFTELNETAGMGMRADEPEFKDQFAGRNVSKFTLNKSGGASADDEVNSVSGASITSTAVVNAVNAGLDFYANTIMGGN